MIEQVNGFITPMKEWDAVGKNLCSSQCLKIQYKMFMTHKRM